MSKPRMPWRPMPLRWPCQAALLARHDAQAAQTQGEQLADTSFSELLGKLPLLLQWLLLLLFLRKGHAPFFVCRDLYIYRKGQKPVPSAGQFRPAVMPTLEHSRTVPASGSISQVWFEPIPLYTVVLTLLLPTKLPAGSKELQSFGGI